MAELDVQFTDEIPKIAREGGKRTSKYAPLIEACVSRPGKAARIVLEGQGKASARATSIRTAADNYLKANDVEGYFNVATRSGEGDNGETEYYVYVQFNEGEEPGDEDSGDEDGDTETPKPKKVAKKKVKRAA